MIYHLKISESQWHHLLIKLRNEKKKKGIFMMGPQVLVKWVHASDLLPCFQVYIHKCPKAESL